VISWKSTSNKSAISKGAFRWPYGVVCLLKSYLDHLSCDNSLRGYKYIFLRNERSGFLEDLSLKASGQIYFQCDGTPPHCTCLAREYVHKSLHNRWLGRGGSLATKDARPSTSWLRVLSLEPNEGISMRNKGWLRGSNAPSNLCSRTSHDQRPQTPNASATHYLLIRAERMHSSWRRKIWTLIIITVRTSRLAK
jgi:hypothetical protein